MTTRKIVVPLSFDKPPLSLNDRMHWARRAAIVRDLRHEVVARLREQRVPRPADHVRVEFHYQPRDNRVRDTDNLVATLKPLVDALAPPRPARRHGKKIIPPTIGYGLVADDNPQYVTRPEPRIHPASRPAACWLELTVTYKEKP